MSAKKGAAATGALWVAGQSALGLLFFFALPAPPVASVAPVLRIAGIAAGLIAAAVATSSVRRIGRHLTPSPLPRPGAPLLRDGIYARARHPMYGAVILGAAAYALFRGSPAHAAGSLAFLLFFTAKSGWEERRLADQYPEYEEYRRSTPRFFPFRRIKHLKRN